MTKKEQAEMDNLREQLRLARALRFTENVLPDVPPPADWKVLHTGYLFNAYGNRVEPGCSSTNFHAVGRTDKTTTQSSVALYSTRLLALRGLRHAVELECATRLAAIDKQIEQELANH